MEAEKEIKRAQPRIGLQTRLWRVLKPLFKLFVCILAAKYSYDIVSVWNRQEHLVMDTEKQYEHCSMAGGPSYAPLIQAMPETQPTVCNKACKDQLGSRFMSKVLHAQDAEIMSDLYEKVQEVTHELLRAGMGMKLSASEITTRIKESKLAVFKDVTFYSKSEDHFSFLVDDGKENLYSLDLFQDGYGVMSPHYAASEFESHYIRKMFFAAELGPTNGRALTMLAILKERPTESIQRLSKLSLTMGEIRTKTANMALSLNKLHGLGYYLKVPRDHTSLISLDTSLQEDALNFDASSDVMKPNLNFERALMERKNYNWLGLIFCDMLERLAPSELATVESLYQLKTSTETKRVIIRSVYNHDIVAHLLFHLSGSTSTLPTFKSVWNHKFMRGESRFDGTEVNYGEKYYTLVRRTTLSGQCSPTKA